MIKRNKPEGYICTDEEVRVWETLNQRVEELEETTFKPTECGLPVLFLEGDTTGISKDDYVELKYTYGDNTGECELKWQGSSSVNMALALGEYGKFNYTIKLDKKIEVVEGWGA